MCIIFFSENGAIPQRSKLKIAHDNNPDGVGLMYHDGKKVATVRGLMSFDDTWNLLKLIQGRPYACHFRYRTRGPINNKTCHPFRIREVGRGFNTWMMHNGTISDLAIPTGQSDTQVFAKNLESLVNDHGSNILMDNKILTNMGKKIQAYNKLIFMNDHGEVKIVNEKSGFSKEGIWYSNDYSFIVDYRKKVVQADLQKSFFGDGEIKKVPNPVSTVTARASSSFPSVKNKLVKNKLTTVRKKISDQDASQMMDDFLDSDFDEITEEDSSRWLEEAKRHGYVHKRNGQKVF